MAQRASTQLKLLLASACVAVVMPTGFAPVASATEQSVAAPRASAAQREVDRARATYEKARERVAALSLQNSRLADNAATTAAEATRLREAVSDDEGGFLAAVGDLLSSGDSDLDRAIEAADNAEHASTLAAMVQEAVTDAIAATEQARHAWERAERRQARIAATWTATEAADATIGRARFASTYLVTDPAQNRRNQRALRAWHQDLREIARNAIIPPGLADLTDASRIEAPLKPLRDAHNEFVPGLAVTHSPGRPAVTVLSAEAVDAVTEAFRRVGLPEVPGAIDPMTYACGGLVANVWGTSPAAADLAADVEGQWTSLRRVPSESVQTGDVVILGSRTDGLAETGVYVGHHKMVLADPVTGVAGVRSLPHDALGIRRVGIGTGQNPALPTSGVCAPTVDAGVATTGGRLVLPVADGRYTLTAGFGDTGARWTSGEHTGLDFAAPVGTPVSAMASGTVTVEQSDWAGDLVRIDHGGGVETWYAHLSRVDVTTGQEVVQGASVGLVGDRGNVTGPHLHAEVRLDGEPYDPAQVLEIPELPRPTYPNGEMPLDALCPATSDGFHLLRCDAAVAYRLLGAAYARDLGSELCITDSYRSRAGQDDVFRRKPTLAATPGTSVHGLGRAVDLCGGVERFDSVENDWLLEQGPSFGWEHPDWAAAGGSRPEPWHFEYAGPAA